MTGTFLSLEGRQAGAFDSLSGTLFRSRIVYLRTGVPRSLTAATFSLRTIWSGILDNNRRLRCHADETLGDARLETRLFLLVKRSRQSARARAVCNLRGILLVY